MSGVTSAPVGGPSSPPVDEPSVAAFVALPEQKRRQHAGPGQPERHIRRQRQREAGLRASGGQRQLLGQVMRKGDAQHPDQEQRPAEYIRPTSRTVHSYP